MAVVIPQVRTLTDAVIAALVAAGLNVGDGQAPEDVGWVDAGLQSNFVPYVVVYPLPGGTVDGSLDEPFADAWPVYQLTSVGGTRQQAEHLGDRARTALLTSEIAVPGRKVAVALLDVLGGALREDDISPPVFYVPERYRLASTPA